MAVQSAVFTEVGCERVMRFAFELARDRSRRKDPSVTKSNASSTAWSWGRRLQACRREYPDVEIESVLVDAMAAKFVLRPEALSVVVASNLHADILFDLGSALAGSLGLAASANLNPERRYRACSSRYTVRPGHRGRESQPHRRRRQRRTDARAPRPAAEAARLNGAIETVTAASVLTRDLGGTATTGDSPRPSSTPWNDGRHAQPDPLHVAKVESPS